jgi:hypothetical protein
MPQPSLLGGQLYRGGRLQHLDLPPQPHEGVPGFRLRGESDGSERRTRTLRRTPSSRSETAPP